MNLASSRTKISTIAFCFVGQAPTTTFQRTYYCPNPFNSGASTSRKLAGLIHPACAGNMSRHVVDAGRRGFAQSQRLFAARTITTTNAIVRAGLRSHAPVFAPTSIATRYVHNAAIRAYTPRSATTTELRWLGRRQEVGIMRWMVQRRWNSSDKRGDIGKRIEQSKEQGSSIPPPTNASTKPADAISIPKPTHDAAPKALPAEHANKSLYDRLPHLHRPTKEELLAAATGFWHRLQIRFKWFSIRSVRPFNHEEIFAFLSWIFWGHVLWFVIGTTTFISLVILAANTMLAQETLAGWVGNYLTRSTGLKVIFESAIVPRWGDGVIRLNKVFVSRRPATNKKERSVTKGSSTTAAAAAEAHALAEKEKQQSGQPLDQAGAEQEDDGNYTQFDVTIENVEVTLSFTKWFNGKGLLRDVAVRGVRGVLDRTSVQPRDESIDPKSYRHEHNTGDFEIDSFKMEDVLLTIYQPNNFRPFQVSVFNLELPRLRKQWLFYDFLCANTAHGSFDNSLFTIHHRQVHSTTGVALVDGHEAGGSEWKKHSRLRIDGLKIDHLNRGVEGPFSWIYEGNVDIVADVMIPNDADGSIAKVMSDFYDRMEATVTNQGQANGRQQQAGYSNSINNDQQSLSGYQEAQHRQFQQQHSPPPQREEDSRFLVMDIQVHLNDVRASVPIFTKDLSYVNNALTRPIVAYINSHAHGNNNYIPISCRIVKRLSEFDGSWTLFDCGMLDDLSRETYEAFVRDIQDRKKRGRRIKKVGLWAASVAAQALFIGLAGQLA